MNLLKEGSINNSRTEILVDVGGKQTPVPVVSHMSSIVDPSDEELESIPGDFLILIQIKTQKVLTHLKKTKDRGIIAVNNQSSQTYTVDMDAYGFTDFCEVHLIYGIFLKCVFSNNNFIATGNTY